MPYNLAEAGSAIGRSKSSILRAIRRGAISATRNEATGEWAIEPAELFRAYPPVASRSPATTEGTERHDAETIELRTKLEAAEARIADKDATIADLRTRLDEERAERRQTTDRLTAAQERIAGLLTDQRAPPPTASRRSWWPWQRR